MWMNSGADLVTVGCAVDLPFNAKTWCNTPAQRARQLPYGTGKTGTGSSRFVWWASVAPGPVPRQLREAWSGQVILCTTLYEGAEGGVIMGMVLYDIDRGMAGGGHAWTIQDSDIFGLGAQGSTPKHIAGRAGLGHFAIQNCPFPGVPPTIRRAHPFPSAYRDISLSDRHPHLLGV
ncbi:hypothetical protein LZ30DRAFT_683139 [Colletotrichum cereale]|nr:hypothetical protein LZ30DRAFT_683139 [Colletotrichum cereale]